MGDRDLEPRRSFDRHGQPIAGDSFYLALNATDADMTFRLPDGWLGAAWSVVFHTAAAHPFEVGPEQVHGPASELDLPARSLLLARRVEPR